MITLTQEYGAASLPGKRRDKAVAEQYYFLAHWLRPIGDASAVAPKTIGVTSCGHGAGVSTVAANLAVIAAQSGDQRVLLLDLSSPRSSLAARFGMADDLGLQDALADVARPGEYVKASPLANLSLLAMSEGADEPSPNMDCGRVAELLQSLEPEFGLIVVDLPTTESSLCFVAAGLLNGILLVVEAERTHAESAARAKQRLIDARANVFGVILNKHRQHIPNWLNARLY